MGTKHQKKQKGLLISGVKNHIKDVDQLSLQQRDDKMTIAFPYRGALQIKNRITIEKDIHINIMTYSERHNVYERSNRGAKMLKSYGK